MSWDGLRNKISRTMIVQYDESGGWATECTLRAAQPVLATGWYSARRCAEHSINVAVGTKVRDKLFIQRRNNMTPLLRRASTASSLW